MTSKNIELARKIPEKCESTVSADDCRILHLTTVQIMFRCSVILSKTMTSHLILEQKAPNKTSDAPCLSCGNTRLDQNSTGAMKEDRVFLLLSSLMARHEWKTTNGSDWQLVKVIQAAYTTSHFWAEKFSTKIWILDQLTSSDFYHLSLGKSKNGHLSLCLQTHHTCCQKWLSPVQNDFSAGLKIPHVSGM